MKVNESTGFPEGAFLDYFLDRMTKKEVRSTVKVPFWAKLFFKFDTLYDILKYSLFNDTTNQAGVHFLLLGAKHVTENITLTGYGVQTISIEKDLPNYIIQAFHCNPIKQDTPSLFAFLIRNKNSPYTSIDILPILRERNLDVTGELEIVIFAMPQNTKENIVYKLLMDAFAYCSQKDFRYAIVAAHNAYELSAKQYFYKFAAELPLNEAAKNFLNKFDRENISSISTKYLPLLTSLTGKPMPPKQISTNILKLTTLRNNLSHKLTNPTEKDISTMYDCVLSSFFICKYFELNIPHKDYPKESFYSTLENTEKTEKKSTTISIWR